MPTSSRIQPSSEDIQTGRIVGIQLGIPSAEDIVQQSVMEIPTSTQGARVTTPMALSALFDSKMGVTKAGEYCPTDGHTYLQCPGYFGHLWLARPVYFSQYTRFIVKVLSLVCWNCSTCLFSHEKHSPVLLHMTGTERTAYVTSQNVPKARRCPRCHADQPKAWKESKDTVGEIRMEWRAPGKRAEAKAAAAAATAASSSTNAIDTTMPVPESVDAMVVFRILDRIDDDTINLIGMHSVFARPSSMICRVLQIAPPATRPSREMDGGQRSEDDLTTAYINVIRYNANLTARIEAGATEQDIAKHIVLLQYAVGCIYSNKFPGGGNLVASSGRPMVTISDRHDGKHGRSRNNLNGKRVDFTARSVISGNPTIGVVELGVPLEMAMTVTRPEVVTKRNREYLISLVKNGPDQWPGANSVVQTGKGRFKRNVCLRSANRHLLVLRVGDVVNRHMRDGDIVGFNRQPSLHKASFMAHVVRVMVTGQSFRLNLAATSSYNADFDGDEMNMHLPQKIAASNELQCIAIVSEQMVDPSKNTPNLSLFQDNMLGLYLFSAEGLEFSLRDAMNLLVCNTSVHLPNLLFGNGGGAKKYDGVQRAGGTIGGARQQKKNATAAAAAVVAAPEEEEEDVVAVVGQKRSRYEDDTSDDDHLVVQRRRVSSLEILSQTLPAISHTAKTKSGGEVKLRNGQWLSGQADQTAIGAGSKGILHRICNDFGKEACVQFIDNVQNLVTLWITNHSSFSVGTGDLHLSAGTLARIDLITKTAMRDVDAVQERFQRGLFENTGAHTNAAEFESQVWNILADARKKVEEVGGRGLAKGNRFLDMVTAGSKGKMVNITQMAMALGQQAISGARAPYGFEQRTLPAFAKFDDGARSGGFIPRSYARGLSPVDYFLHAVAGREGLIDTAIKTSETGYTARRLRTLLEIDEIRYDGMVRDHSNRITQFRYGDDGFHSETIEEQSFPLVTLDIGAIAMRYDLPLWGNNRLPAFVRMFTPEAAGRLDAEKEETMRMCLETTNYLVQARDAVVDKVFRGQFGNTVHLPMNIASNIEQVRGMFDLENSLLDLTPLDALTLVREFDDKLVRIQCGFRNPLLTAAVHFWLNPRELLLEFRFHRAALVTLLATLELRFKQALAPAGETVGVNAAQCIAEPVTQLTLNTFHSTGLITAKTTGTKGVSRIMEIISATENTKKPSMTLFLLPGDETSRARASDIANRIACLVLDTVVSVAQIVYDPVDRQTQIADDVEWLREFHAFQDSFFADASSSSSGSDDNNYSSAQLLLEGVEQQQQQQSGSSAAAPAATPMSSWIIRLELNARTMLDKNVSMDDIHYAVANYFDSDGVQIAYADFNNDRLVVRVRTQTLMNSGRANQASLDASDHLNYLKRAMLGMLQNVVLRGVRGIANATPRKMTDQVFREDGAFVRRDTWVIDTDGSNLPGVLALDDLIDVRRVQCNNIREVHMTLGIECTRDTIIREFTEVMGDVKVNYHHLSLLADRMCMTANMVGAVHGGLNSDATGPLAHMSFERHSKMSVEAAVHGEMDNMRGLTANIMCGQRGLFGTGAFNVLVDVDAFARNRVDRNYDMENDADDPTNSNSNNSKRLRDADDDEDDDINGKRQRGDDVDAGLAALSREYTACQNMAIVSNLEAVAVAEPQQLQCYNDGYEMF